MMDGYNKNKKYYLSVSFIILAGIMWGTMGLFVRNLAADGLSTIEIVFFRSVLAAVLMFLYCIVGNRTAMKIKLKDIWCFVGTGIISLTLFNICYFTTIQRTSMAVAAILLYTSPIFVVLLSALLFKEKLTLSKIIALIIAFAGCVFVTGIVGGSLIMDATGILIGIGSGIGYALYSIFGRFAIQKGYSSVTISFYTFVFASIGMVAVSPVLNPIGVTISKIAQGNIIRDVLLLVGIALIATVLPYVFYTLGLTGVENGKAGIMASVEPVVASILGIVVYREKLTVSTILGIILVLAAIVILNIEPKKED